ncbi:MAG: hypothetical protein JWQ11_1595 [Rhizobacter sp.]|nr:hypothetical protein [Rhizobacter sp.]
MTAEKVKRLKAWRREGMATEGMTTDGGPFAIRSQ